MEKWQKITIGIASVFLILGISGLTIFEFYIKPNYIAPAIKAAEELFDSEEDLTELLNAVGEELAKQGQVQDTTKSETKENKQEAMEVEGKKDTEEDRREIKKQNGKESTKVENSKEQKVDPKNSGKKDQNTDKLEDKDKEEKTISVPIKTVSGKDVNELQKKVDWNDRIEGVKLASKVDVGYLLNLSKGGITAEDKVKAKEHLKSKLTEEEYNRVKQLVVKYSSLLN
ncbi:MAG: hypothetical protein GX238_02075 [Epulopiscium sp.]|nr:hypothetical protein [Candidatus Epulonipiscium sp.]